MREVELKVKVRNYSEAKKKLKENGWLPIEKLHQSDFIFLKEGQDFRKIQKGTPVVRLRLQGANACYLNVKVSQSHELDCIEHETLVEDAIEARKILQLLNLKEAVKVSKKREVGTLGNFTLCLDQVEELGSFIELEALISDENSDMECLRVDMIERLKKMDLDIECEVKVGYDTLVFNKKNTYE